MLIAAIVIYIVFAILFGPKVAVGNVRTGRLSWKTRRRLMGSIINSRNSFIK